MGKREVPWHEGRMALVRYVGPDANIASLHGHWAAMEAFRVYSTERRRWWGPGVSMADELVETALLPDQCPTCYEVGGHADNCLPGTMAAHGVPAFWAPWLQHTMPLRGDVCYALTVKGDLIQLRRDVDGWETVDGIRWGGVRAEDEALGVVALGPDGPTLAPWEPTPTDEQPPAA